MTSAVLRQTQESHVHLLCEIVDIVGPLLETFEQKPGQPPGVLLCGCYRGTFAPRRLIFRFDSSPHNTRQYSDNLWVLAVGKIWDYAPFIKTGVTQKGEIPHRGVSCERASWRTTLSRTATEGSDWSRLHKIHVGAAIVLIRTLDLLLATNLPVLPEDAERLLRARVSLLRNGTTCSGRSGDIHLSAASRDSPSPK
jgi:hypothetical protein